MFRTHGFFSGIYYRIAECTVNGSKIQIQLIRTTQSKLHLRDGNGVQHYFQNLFSYTAESAHIKIEVDGTLVRLDRNVFIQNPSGLKVTYYEPERDEFNVEDAPKYLVENTWIDRNFVVYVLVRSDSINRDQGALFLTSERLSEAVKKYNSTRLVAWVKGSDVEIIKTPTMLDICHAFF